MFQTEPCIMRVPTTPRDCMRGSLRRAWSVFPLRITERCDQGANCSCSVLLWGRAAMFISIFLSASCSAFTSQATLWERFLYGEWRGISCHFLKFLPAAYQHWTGLIWVELQPARANPGSYFRGTEWQLWRCHFSACDLGAGGRNREKRAIDLNCKHSILGLSSPNSLASPVANNISYVEVIETFLILLKK